MKCEEVWLYYGSYSEPTKGYVIWTEDCITDGYFIREGSSVDCGWLVNGVEGEVGDNGSVWFKHRVSVVEIKEAYRKWYEEKIETMSMEIETYKSQLRMLG